MTCGLAIAATLLLSDPNVALAAAQPPAAAEAPVSVAAEPLFADIIQRSASLKATVDGWTTDLSANADWTLDPAVLETFRTDTHALSELDMQGHLILKERGTDGDLKCILRGISEDIPRKVEALEAATDPRTRREALSALSYLLRDNVEVITSPPQPEV
jgi:hypothetical protein